MALDMELFPADMLYPTSGGGSLDMGPPTAMIIAMGVFGLLFTATVVFIIVTAVRNSRAARARGIDPMTMQTELAARLMESEMLRPAQPPSSATDAATRPLEERLRELDDLHNRGVISAEERAEARAKILST